MKSKTRQDRELKRISAQIKRQSNGVKRLYIVKNGVVEFV